MKILQGLRRFFGGNATSVQSGDQSSDPGHYGQESATYVTEDTAMQVSAVWACARLLSEVFASLPITMYDKKKGVGSAVTDHTLVNVLTESPNSRMTPVEFYETMQLNLVLHGNCYARIERNSRGDVIALWPLPARHVQPELQRNGSVVYHWYHDSDVTVFADKSILHVRIFGNGLIGLSPLAYARNAIGLASAADNYASKYFVNGGKPSGVLYTDAALSKEQRQAARDTFTEIVEEKEESRRLLVLPLGFKYQQVQISPGDMQMLENRRMQAKEICRFMGNIPPVLIGETEGTTTLGSSIEQILLSWYRIGLNPYATRWEQAIAKKLLRPEERVRYNFHVDFAAFTRGDSKALMEYIKGMVGGPVMVPNEGRAMINLPPVENGDRLNPAPTEARKEEKKEVKGNA